MTPTTAILVLLASTPPSAPKSTPTLMFSSGVERIRLPLRHLAVHADVWRNELELTAEVSGPALLKLLPKGAAAACPRRVASARALTLRCDSGRVQAVVIAEAGACLLELSLTRGLPWREDGHPALGWHYPPERFGLGAPCPGSTPEGEVECHVAAAASPEQLLHEVEGLKGPSALVRAGDLALARNDPLAAMNAWEQAGRLGLFGRLANARLCELTGNCLGNDAEKLTFDGSAMPEPAQTELELRFIRALALCGRRDEAISKLNERVSDLNRPDACALWPQVCDGVTGAALSDERPAIAALGMEVFLRRTGSHINLSLSRQAADTAAALGAPAFGANLLAAATGSARGPQLETHLRRVIDLYELAGDSVRADVVREYAEAVIKKGRPARKPAVESADRSEGKAMAKAAARMTALEEAVRTDLELASAISAISKARER